MSLFCEHGRPEGQLCLHCIGVLDESGVQELQRIRLDNHRLAEQLRAADLERIRLRAGLREALSLLEHRVIWSDMPPDDLRNRADMAAIAELRKLVTP